MPDNLLFRNRYRIPSTRLKGWDYGGAGVYSITPCARGRICWFGEVVEDRVELSPLGEVVAEEWRKIPDSFDRVTLDEWIVMPDHLHGILVFKGRPPEDLRVSSRMTPQSLGAVMGQFKSNASKRIWWNLRHRDFAWQDRFHDAIVRDTDALDNLRAYIRGNPRRWTESRPSGSNSVL
ncbi:MAG TPA: transposase [Thermoanaerobaculia bacterium]|nr:transposase [Thermoanaerobaculia bacterium]